jgi:pilus assembly protein CpaF
MTVKTNTIWELINKCENENGLSEIIINNADSVYIEKDGLFTKVNVKIPNEDLHAFITEVAKFNRKDFSENTPCFDGVLSNGMRINMVFPSLTQKKYPAITIRRFNRAIQKFDNGVFGLSGKHLEVVEAMVKSKMNLLIVGSTGSGKTTFLNLLLNEVPADERVVVIEDTRELSIKHANSVSLETKATSGSGANLKDLVKNSLRMRPDRIIVGEVRGDECRDLVISMNTGHKGCFCTIHANSAYEGLTRMEMLFLMAGLDIPLKAIRYQIMKAIDFIIYLERAPETGERLVKQIIEITNMEGDKILYQEIGRNDGSKFRFSGIVPTRIKELNPYGIPSTFFTND